MDWTAAIERNCDALLRVAAALFAIVRLPGGAMVAMLPRHLYFQFLRVLRPAESAVRRLVVLQEMQLEIPSATRSAEGTARPSRESSATRKGVKPAPEPAFQLFDPFKPLPTDPWITECDDDSPNPVPEPFAPPRQYVDATQLCRRLRALISALDDLPAQARRLARWRIRKLRPRWFSSLRPGWPPGHRKRPLHEVDAILRECRMLLHRAQSPPQTL